MKFKTIKSVFFKKKILTNKQNRNYKINFKIKHKLHKITDKSIDIESKKVIKQKIKIKKIYIYQNIMVILRVLRYPKIYNK